MQTATTQQTGRNTDKKQSKTDRESVKIKKTIDRIEGDAGGDIGFTPIRKEIPVIDGW